MLKNSGHHMEHTIKGSYAALLIGHIITDNEEYETLVRRHLRGNGFKEIVSVLEKYYTFMDLTCVSTCRLFSYLHLYNSLSSLNIFSPHLYISFQIVGSFSSGAY